MPRPGSARSLAFRHLRRVEADGAYVSLVAGEGGDAADARRATAIVAGVTRMRRYLDFLIGAYYRGTRELDDAVRTVLRIGLYELVVEGRPPHAVVNETANLARAVLKRGRKPNEGAVRLVNGLLRSVARTQALPVPSGDAADVLAVTHSHPTWMVRRWLDRYGAEATEALLKANNEAPRFGLRATPGRLTTERLGDQLDALGVDWEPSPFLPDVLRVERLQPVIRAGLLERGQVQVQDEAAALVVHVLDPQPGDTIYDLCAAPGSKAVYAAERIGARGSLKAFDVHPGRADLVRQAAAARGLEQLTVEAADALDLPARTDIPPAHRVLLDAPCSGLGVLGKRADLRWRTSPEQIAELAALQDRLLDAAAGLVQPGGLLVYSTCTLAPEENAERVAAFLQRHPEFEREPVGDLVPPALRTPDGDYQALPHREGTDGAYATRLRRRP